MVQQIVGTLAGRWYVIVFGVAFLIFATSHMGIKRMLLYAGVALGVGALAENGSVLVGFPYTRYMFNPDLRGHELWIFDVPLMVPMSYAFLTYFAFAATRLLVSGPFTSRGRQPILEYALAVVLATWALWVIDPVSRLGRYHMVGELFHYAGPGFWFGLPLGSQLGFFATSGILIALLTYMMRNEPAIAVPGLRHHPRLPSLLTYLGEVIFMGRHRVCGRAHQRLKCCGARRSAGRRGCDHRGAGNSGGSNLLAFVATAGSRTGKDILTWWPRDTGWRAPLSTRSNGSQACRRAGDDGVEAPHGVSRVAASSDF